MPGIPLPPSTDYWQDASFVRQAKTDILVACYVAATLGTDASGNENTGPLHVVRYDDSDPPAPGAPQVIETGLCTAAKLSTRPDGTLDLFYGYDCVSIRHRASRDGGETWSAPATVHSSAGPVCAVDVAVPLGTPPYTSRNGNFDALNVAFVPEGGLFYVWHLSEFSGSSSGWRSVGVLDADGETVTWAAPTTDTSPAVNPPMRVPQLLRDGSTLRHSAAVWLYLAADGTSIVRPLPGAAWSPTGPAWIDERTGLWVSASLVDFGGTPHIVRWRIGRGHLDPDGVVRTGTNSTTPMYLDGWGDSPLSRGYLVGQMGVRADGCWEFFFAQPSGDLDFKRCYSVPLNETGAASAMVWA